VADSDVLRFRLLGLGFESRRSGRQRDEAVRYKVGEGCKVWVRIYIYRCGGVNREDSGGSMNVEIGTYGARHGL
jgi:hypothetical protein